MITISISKTEFDNLIFSELVDTNCLATVTGGFAPTHPSVRDEIGRVRVPRMIQIKDVNFVENI